MNTSIRMPHWGWWIAIIGGMSLTAWIGFTATGYQQWSGTITGVLPQTLFQWIFWLAILTHVLEAGYAFRFARSNRIENPELWAMQTFLLGYPSIRLLKSGTKTL